MSQFAGRPEIFPSRFTICFGISGETVPQNLPAPGRAYNHAHDAAQTRLHRAGNPIAARSLDRCDAACLCDARAKRRLDSPDDPPPSARDRHTGNAGVSGRREERHLKETIAVPHDSPIALMVSSTQSVRPSNHEGVLTSVNREHHRSGPSVRVPREEVGEEWRRWRELVRGTNVNDASPEPCKGPPVLWNRKAREALRTPSRHCGPPPSRATRWMESATA